MPVLDMPLEKLKEYRGINPQPDDFDEYWERALKELDSVSPDLSMTDAGFENPVAECYDMYFTGTHGGRIYCKFLKPKNIKGKCPVLFNFHGYGGSSSEWSAYLGYVASGFAVAAMDARGQAGKSTDPHPVSGNTLHGQIIRGLEDHPDNLLFRDIFLDTALLARIVLGFDYIDETKAGAYGGSQGGGLSLACASLEPRIKYVAPVFPFLSDYKRAWDMDLNTSAYLELKEFFMHTDPRHEREDEFFTKLGYIDLQYLAQRIKGEVLFFTALSDNMVPASAQFAMYNKLTCKKNMHIYPDFGHVFPLPDSEDMTYEFLSQLLD